VEISQRGHDDRSGRRSELDLKKTLFWRVFGMVVPGAGNFYQRAFMQGTLLFSACLFTVDLFSVFLLVDGTSFTLRGNPVTSLATISCRLESGGGGLPAFDSADRMDRSTDRQDARKLSAPFGMASWHRRIGPVEGSRSRRSSAACTPLRQRL